MAIKTTTNINIDFYDKKYISINAKQLDRGSRFLSVTCYNQGELVKLNDRDYAAYIRYRKADDYSVFNFCDIDNRGKIIVELTEQMLAVDGICVVDLVIVERGKAEVNDNGEIINIDNTAVLSTMPIHIDVTEAAANNSDIESTYEFNLLNTKLEEYWADFEEVVTRARSWAEGGTGTRDGEDTDNAQYYYEQSNVNATSASRSAERAGNSESNAANSADKSQSYAIGGTGTRGDEDIDNAKYYSQMSKSYAVGGTDMGTRSEEDTDNAEYYSRLAKSYAIGSFDGSTETRNDENTENAKTYMETTNTYMKATEGFKNEVDGYKTTVSGYMETTEGYKSDAEDYMNNAAVSASNASTSATNASISETNASNSANMSKSYAVGETGTRLDENTDNAKYYYELIKNIVIGLDTGFIPMGTVSFSELATVEKATGYVYNISDNFITDSTFREGEGNSYTAGTNVYYTANGDWDCFGGAAFPTATIDEVKDYLGIDEENKENEEGTEIV